jgi:aspartyl-tRNA synthetase
MVVGFMPSVPIGFVDVETPTLFRRTPGVSKK